MDNPGGVADDDQGSGWFEVKKVSLPELILILLDVYCFVSLLIIFLGFLWLVYMSRIAKLCKLTCLEGFFEVIK